jgi:hypothetical protein
MGLLTREQILATGLKVEPVNVPEWGGTVLVRELDGLGREAFHAALVGEDGQPDTAQYAEKLVALSLVDEAGVRLFGLDDVHALAQRSALAMARVFAVADRMSAVGNSAVDAAEKNSEAGQTGDSSAGSL